MQLGESKQNHCHILLFKAACQGLLGGLVDDLLQESFKLKPQVGREWEAVYAPPQMSTPVLQL